jgi:hypothetical protein
MGSGDIAPPFLTSALDEADCSVSPPGFSTPGETDLHLYFRRIGLQNRKNKTPLDNICTSLWRAALCIRMGYKPTVRDSRIIPCCLVSNCVTEQRTAQISTFDCSSALLWLSINLKPQVRWIFPYQSALQKMQRWRECFVLVRRWFESWTKHQLCWGNSWFFSFFQANGILKQMSASFLNNFQFPVGNHPLISVDAR